MVYDLHGGANEVSGVPAMTQQKLPKLRRLSQILFLLLFLLLMMKADSFSSLRAARDGPRLPYPVSFFLQLDPLTAVASALSSHTLYRGLLWSLAILIPTFFLGRFFCGWICPLGTLNHFFEQLEVGAQARPGAPGAEPL